MSKKRTRQSVLNDLPTIDSPTQIVCRHASPRGKNMHVVTTPSGMNIVAYLPPRFRNTVWLKRGNHLIVETREHEVKEDKLSGEILYILNDKHIKHLQQHQQWYAFNGVITRH
jgi:probable RNA-binding protein EIF1AD